MCKIRNNNHTNFLFIDLGTVLLQRPSRRPYLGISMISVSCRPLLAQPACIYLLSPGFSETAIRKSLLWNCWRNSVRYSFYWHPKHVHNQAARGFYMKIYKGWMPTMQYGYNIRFLVASTSIARTYTYTVYLYQLSKGDIFETKKYFTW